MKHKNVFIALGIILVVVAVLVGISFWQGSQPAPSPSKVGNYKLSTVENMFKNIDYSQYDLDAVLVANELAGNISENIEGKADAPIVLYEYADYQCSFCAAMNPLLNQIIEDSNDKVALVFRSYILSYHENGVAATAAANAAAIQGYWGSYKDLLFANQNDWFYSKDDELMIQLEGYFMTASDNKGDLLKFRDDMASEAVLQKIAFDMGAGEYKDIGGTPWIYLDGEWIDHEGANPATYAEKIRKLVEEKVKSFKK